MLSLTTWVTMLTLLSLPSNVIAQNWRFAEYGTISECEDNAMDLGEQSGTGPVGCTPLAFVPGGYLKIYELNGNTLEIFDDETSCTTVADMFGDNDVGTCIEIPGNWRAYDVE